MKQKAYDKNEPRQFCDLLFDATAPTGMSKNESFLAPTPEQLLVSGELT